METYQESPDPSYPLHDTESDPCWGWLGLACETNNVCNCLVSYFIVNKFKQLQQDSIRPLQMRL